MELDADLHSTSQHVNDETGPLSATESIVQGKQHDCQAYPKSGANLVVPQRCIDLRYIGE